MEEKISIIVAVYNIEAYIERCIKSLLNQSYRNLEILLIDDGSTDGSGQICRKLGEGDSRIRYIYKDNGGLSDARNTGMKAATGEYFSFIDGDDCIHPDMYRILYDGVRKENVKIGLCSFQTFEKEEELKLPDKTENTSGTRSSHEILQLLFTPQRTDIVIACCKLYHKSLLMKFPFPSGRYREDEFTVYRYWFEVDRVFYTTRKLYYYFQRSDSILHAGNVKKETDYYDALLERHQYFIKKDMPESFLSSDSAFCARQLYNVFFLDMWADGSHTQRYYIDKYKQMYDAVFRKAKPDRYFCARFFPMLFMLAWRWRKRIKGKDGSI